MTTTLKPGYLVALRTTVRGSVVYERRDPAHETNGQTVTDEWETTRTIRDQRLHELVTEVRSKARQRVVNVCTATDFGLYCLRDNRPALNDALADAQKMIDDVNRLDDVRALGVRVRIFWLIGEVGSDDDSAARAIADELRGLLDTVKDGLRDLDAEKIREAAGRALKLGAMLDDDTNSKVTAAIADVRRRAREVVKAVKEYGDNAARIVSTVEPATLAAARFALLDTAEVPADADCTPAVAAQRFADLDQPDAAPAPGPAGTGAGLLF